MTPQFPVSVRHDRDGQTDTQMDKMQSLMRPPREGGPHNRYLRYLHCIAVSDIFEYVSLIQYAKPMQ